MIIFATLIVSNAFFSYVYADSDTNNCAACGSTPNWMQMYINFEVDVLWILQWASAQTESLWRNWKSWLFAGGVLSTSGAIVKSFISKFEKNLDTELKAVRAARISSVLLFQMTLPNTFTDGLLPIAILFKNDAFVRDYKILQELEMSANDVIWDMWVNWLWDKTISSEIQSSIANLQSTYSQMYNGNNPIFQKITISGGVKYKDMLKFVLKLNSMMKALLYNTASQTGIDGYIDGFEETYSAWNIVVVINRDIIDSTLRDYKCANTLACNKSLSDAFKDFWNWSNFTSSLSSSRKSIKDSINDFKQALLNSPKTYTKTVWWTENSGGLSDRQLELLYSVYGIDAHDLTTTQLESLKSSWETVKEESIPVIDAVWSDKSIITATYYSIKNRGQNQQKQYENTLTEQEIWTNISASLSQSYLPLSQQWDNLLHTMQETIDQILSDKYLDKQILLTSTNRDTHYFVEIWYYIHSIMENEIWDKNLKWLVKNLGEVCEYQCSNKWTKNCYAD